MTADELFLEPTIGKPADKIGYFATRAGFDRFAAAYRDGLATLPVPDETAAATTTFGPVRGYRFGDGDGIPLVLLSGRQASTPMWRANLPGLVPGRTVWSIDSIGEPGASSQHRPLTGAADQAAWVDEALAGLGIERAHLFGVSIGGWLATQVAIHRPGRAASVTLLDPANTFAPLTWKMIVVSLGSVIPGLPMAVRHRLLGWISGGARSDDSVPEGRLIASAMRDFSSAQPAPARPTEAELAAIDLPVLAIIAGRSIVHDAERAAAAARRIPGARVELWPDASHAVNGEFPDRIAERFTEFAAGID
ncbi:pimeloyl-ACP methyl ester carboxylesterase [Nocardia transvalensis]|uniref:Pimeloyl-ACP methyl ester carboxylesterase n=1 Tax=Nocardia transvalensis TaxID=37333 RepID=A0A7W9PGZ4_9NOCA|nr:alpha/beta hydrolase [Nocardia transvalensis]MBB5915882.1 pimeloyl-ACP methyl ester carboxylesterase [Nocardia transvalensis]